MSNLEKTIVPIGDGAARTVPTQTNMNPARNLAGKIGKLVFFAQLVAVSILISYLSIRGFLSHFLHAHFYLPLITSTAISSIAAAAWLLLTLYRPSAALGVPTIALAFVQSLFACWIAPRLYHAGRILSASIQFNRFDRSAAAGVVYSLLYTLGVGGVASAAPLYVATLLLSLAWTSHVLQNIPRVRVHGKGFATDTWEMIVRRGMVRQSFCFLTWVAGGTLAALVAGSWALAVKVGYTTSVMVYSFYFKFTVGKYLLFVVVVLAATIQQAGAVSTRAVVQPNPSTGLAVEKSYVFIGFVFLCVVLVVTGTILFWKHLKRVWEFILCCFTISLEAVRAGCGKVKRGWQIIRDLSIEASAAKILWFMFVMTVIADFIHVVAYLISEYSQNKHNTTFVIIVDVTGYVFTYLFIHVRLIFSAGGQREMANHFPDQRKLEDIFSFVMGLILFFLSKMEDWIQIQQGSDTISKISLLLISSAIGLALQAVALVIGRFYGLIVMEGL